MKYDARDPEQPAAYYGNKYFRHTAAEGYLKFSANRKSLTQSMHINFECYLRRDIGRADYIS